MLPMLVESTMSVFFFLTIRLTPRSCSRNSFAEFFTSISPLTQSKNQCITESGTRFNSTVLITFILLLILLYKKMFCILPKKLSFIFIVSKCTMCPSLCWYFFFNLYVAFPCFHVIMCFLFYLWTSTVELLNWIHTHWTVNNGGIFWFDYTFTLWVR